MPLPHAHPNGLRASSWAPHRISASSASSHDQSGGLLDISNRPLQHLNSDRRRERPRPRMRQRHLAPLGTREDVEAEDYESPVGSMFARAFERYRTAQETRTQAYNADQYLAASNENVTPNPLRRTANSTDNVANQQFPEHFDYAMTPHHDLADLPWLRSAAAEFQRRRESQVAVEQRQEGDTMASERVQIMELMRQTQALELRLTEAQHDLPASPPAPTIETQRRPSPTPSEDMVVNIACTICKEYPIDIILQPCRHACMCKWCAELCVPTRPNMPYALPPQGHKGKCPKCRREVKEVRPFYFG